MIEDTLNEIAAIIALVAPKSGADCIDAITQLLLREEVDPARLEEENYDDQGVYLPERFDHDTLEKARDVIMRFAANPTPLGASHTQLAALLNELINLTERDPDEEDCDGRQADC